MGVAHADALGQYSRRTSVHEFERISAVPVVAGGPRTPSLAEDLAHDSWVEPTAADRQCTCAYRKKIIKKASLKLSKMHM